MDERAVRLVELTCEELVELVTAYFEGALPPRERARLEQHLRDCPGCVAYLEQMGQTIRLTGVLRDDQLAPAARDALMNAFRAWNEGVAKQRVVL